MTKKRGDVIESAAGDDGFRADERLAERLEWFQDMRFGLMMHWGPYCQWSCIESWPLVPADTWARPDGMECWEQRGRDIARFQRDYWDLNKTFNPVRFDAAPWAAAAKRAGMKYVVFTTKHHDGFSVFDTRQTDYRVTADDCPYHTAGVDIVRAVFDAARAEGLAIGVYFSKSDWHHPDYWDPSRPIVDRHPNYDTAAEPAKWARFAEFVYRQIEELMTGYGPVDILWLDGGQVRPPRQDVNMDRIAAMARTHQPGLIIADRTVGGPHENYLTPEQEIPDEPMGRAWESCITLGHGWSYRPDDTYKPAGEVIRMLVDCACKGGNLLLNVGPSPLGEFAPDAMARLGEVADWMAVNGEAVHATRAVAPYKRGPLAFTRKGADVYAIYLPEGAEATLPAEICAAPFGPGGGQAVRMLGVDVPLSARRGDAGMTVTIPESVRRDPPCEHAWVLKLAGAAAG